MKITGLILAVPGLVLTSLMDFTREPPARIDAVTRVGIPLDQISALPRDPWAITVALERGEPVNRLDLQGRTTLMWAAQNGHVEIARRLLEQGVDVHATDWWGRSALSMALENGHREIVTLLIAHQADISTRASRATAPPLPG